MLQMVRGLVRVWHQRDVTSMMKHEIVVDIEGFQMRREMSSDSEDSYISELSDLDHEERKVEEEQSSVRIALSVCGTNVTSKIKSSGILTARFRFNPKHLKLRNRVFQTIYFSTVSKKISCHMHFKHIPLDLLIPGCHCLH